MKKVEILRALKESKGWVNPVRVAQMVENVGSNRTPSNVPEYENKLRELEKDGLVEEDPNTQGLPERSEFDITEKGEEELEAGAVVGEVWEKASEEETEFEEARERLEKADGVVEEGEILAELLERHPGTRLADELDISNPIIYKKAKITELSDTVKELIGAKLMPYQAALEHFLDLPTLVTHSVCQEVKDRNGVSARELRRIVKEKKRGKESQDRSKKGEELKENREKGVKTELTRGEKERLIRALIYEHYNFDIEDPSDDKLVELILKIAEGGSE